MIEIQRNRENSVIGYDYACKAEDCKQENLLNMSV
jgi:hypothetical protein